MFQESDSDEATRDPDPVFPSTESMGVLRYAPLSRDLEDSRAAELNPEPRGELFHMLPPQPLVVFPKLWPKDEWEGRSFSPLLTGTPP